MIEYEISSIKLEQWLKEKILNMSAEMSRIITTGFILPSTDARATALKVFENNFKIEAFEDLLVEMKNWRTEDEEEPKEEN